MDCHVIYKTVLCSLLPIIGHSMDKSLVESSISGKKKKRFYTMRHLRASCGLLVLFHHPCSQVPLSNDLSAAHKAIQVSQTGFPRRNCSIRSTQNRGIYVRIYYCSQISIPPITSQIHQPMMKIQTYIY